MNYAGILRIQASKILHSSNFNSANCVGGGSKIENASHEIGQLDDHTEWVVSIEGTLCIPPVTRVNFLQEVIVFFRETVEPTVRANDTISSIINGLNALVGISVTMDLITVPISEVNGGSGCDRTWS